MIGDATSREAPTGEPRAVSRCLSAGAEYRLREVRTLLPLIALMWGGVFGGVAWSLRAAGGVALLATSTLLAVVPLLFWPKMRRRTCGMFGLAVTLVLYLQFTFVCVGLTALSLVAPLWAVLLVAAVTFALVGWRLPRDVRRFDAEWETNRMVNEREVLDLTAGTYDLGRRFTPLVGRGRGRAITSSRDAAELTRKAAPLVAGAATLGSVLAVHGAADVRVVALAALCPVATVGLTGALAQAVVHVRRLRGYERRLGRPILNR